MVDVDDLDSLSKFFEDNTAFEEYSDHLGRTVSSCDDLFSILEALESTAAAPEISPLTVVPLGTDHETASSPPKMAEDDTKRSVTQNSVSSGTRKDTENHEMEANPATPSDSKKRKISTVMNSSLEEAAASDGQKQKTTVHVTVERNRRKQMNEHLSVLRSLMPSFYVKRGDQASIIGGVVDYIKEMQQVLQSLEAKKQRKFYSEILSPRLVSSPRPSPILSPRKPPLSPRILSLPTSPRTPNQTSPCKPRMMHQAATIPHEFPSSSSSTSENAKELIANSKSSVADVEVKFSGPNVLLKTVSGRIPGQVTKMIAALEAFSLEILHLSINIIEATMINSFTIKIGIECQLSADELAQGIQQTFCC